MTSRSISSSRLSPVIGSCPWSLMYFSMSLLSNIWPEIGLITGCSGVSLLTERQTLRHLIAVLVPCRTLSNQIHYALRVYCTTNLFFCLRVYNNWSNNKALKPNSAQQSTYSQLGAQKSWVFTYVGVIHEFKPYLIILF